MNKRITRMKLGEGRKPIKSNLKRLDAMCDEDIDYSEIPEFDDSILKNAKVVMPPEQNLEALRQALIDGENSGESTPLDMEKICREAKMQAAINQGLESGIVEDFDMEKIQREIDSEAGD